MTPTSSTMPRSGWAETCEAHRRVLTENGFTVDPVLSRPVLIRARVSLGEVETQLSVAPAGRDEPRARRPLRATRRNPVPAGTATATGGKGGGP